VLLTEYNAKHQRKLDRRDARAEGRIEGRAEGRLQGYTEANAKIIKTMLRKGKTPEEIRDLLDYSMEEIEQVELKLKQ
jgi:predicted transposase YdaD